jgi:hypothetical protein
LRTKKLTAAKRRAFAALAVAIGLAIGSKFHSGFTWLAGSICFSALALFCWQQVREALQTSNF